MSSGSIIFYLLPANILEQSGEKTENNTTTKPKPQNKNPNNFLACSPTCGLHGLLTPANFSGFSAMYRTTATP